MKRLGLILILPILWLGAWFVAIRYLTCIFTNVDKAWNIALMIDETCNVGANGEVQTTISARAGRAQNDHKMWGCILCRILGWIQPHHCDRAMKN